jgi:succinate dehydrogenase/fumarate reductase cytochrome b subunit
MASKLKGTILLIIIVVLIVLSLLFHILALVTDYWLEASDTSRRDFMNLGVGRWVACFNDYEHTHEPINNRFRLYTGCHNLYSAYYESIRDWLIPSWLVVCRILAFIALVLQIVGVVLFVLLLLVVIYRWIRSGDKSDGWCERIILYCTPIAFMLAATFLMMTVMIFADNAFRLQCQQYWLGGQDPNVNRLGYSWVFELVACILTYATGGFLMWLMVLKGKDEI